MLTGHVALYGLKEKNNRVFVLPKEGIFNTKYPMEASEMIMIYSNEAFDDDKNLTPEQKKAKGVAFLYKAEKILGAKEGSLAAALMQFFG